MTDNAKLKKAVRRRMAQTGEKFTEARRNVMKPGTLPGPNAASGAAEPHYAFTPPGTIEFVDAKGARYVPVPEDAGPGFSWGYAGTGPNTSAWALLLDAKGSADQALAMAFTDDHLDWWDEIGDREFVITVAEVRVWRSQAEPQVRAEEAASLEEAQVTRLSDMLHRVEEYKEAAENGPRKPWWQTYRDAHGGPSLGS